ncbi:hypothetical protein TELCIR_16149 [Teladorsagia circumcincta]|uniref:Uncharacterized protein n=1 Tax=Teladorsagia circumcincta TaxID=45464 RepID=A0A2G9TYI8_TELCI|nr:hypothetical protein TELCIR_16149 [Teladorsagia circumcincta]
MFLRSRIPLLNTSSFKDQKDRKYLSPRQIARAIYW